MSEPGVRDPGVVGQASPGAQLAGSALAWMRRNHRRPISVADVAAQVGVSHRKLRDMFRQHIGTAPGKALRDIRLDAGRALLRNCPGITVQDVAAAVGFKNHSTFTTVYRARFGVPPSADKRRCDASRPHTRTNPSTHADDT